MNMTKLSSKMATIFVVLAMVYVSVSAFAVEEGEAKKLWDTCLLKIRPKCALDIIGYVFGNGTISVSCCHARPCSRRKSVSRYTYSLYL